MRKKVLMRGKKVSWWRSFVRNVKVDLLKRTELFFAQFISSNFNIPSERNLFNFGLFDYAYSSSQVSLHWWELETRRCSMIGTRSYTKKKDKICLVRKSICILACYANPFCLIYLIAKCFSRFCFYLRLQLTSCWEGCCHATKLVEARVDLWESGRRKKIISLICTEATEKEG